MHLISSIDPSAAGSWVAAFLLAVYTVFNHRSNRRTRKVCHDVQSQFNPNGGSTIKDQLNRIESAQRWGLVKDKVLIDAGGIMGFTCDKAGLCTGVSSAYLSLVERPLEDVLGNGWLQCVCESDRDHVRREWRSAVADQRIFDLHYAYQAASGRVFRCRVRALPVKTLTNDLLGFEGFLELAH